MKRTFSIVFDEIKLIKVEHKGQIRVHTKIVVMSVVVPRKLDLFFSSDYFLFLRNSSLTIYMYIVAMSRNGTFVSVFRALLLKSISL